MILGIDIGGTTITLGLVDDNKILRKVTVPSFAPEATLEDTYKYLCNCITDFVSPKTLEMIGIGVPSVVDSRRGIVYGAVNIPSWKEAHLKEELESRIGVRVCVNNDANCFALGAASMLSLESKEIVVCITLGTGVGAGVLYKGQLINGRNTGFGEIGSLQYNGRTIEEYSGKNFFTEQGADPQELALRAQNGDEGAKDTFAAFGKYVGEMLAMVVFAYDPDVIVIGGGLSNNFSLFEESMRSRLSARIPYANTINNLTIGALPDTGASIIGASKL